MRVWVSWGLHWPNACWYVRKFSKTVRCVRTSIKVTSRENKVNNNCTITVSTVRLIYPNFYFINSQTESQIYEAHFCQLKKPWWLTFFNKHLFIILSNYFGNVILAYFNLFYSEFYSDFCTILHLWTDYQMLFAYYPITGTLYQMIWTNEQNIWLTMSMCFIIFSSRLHT